MNKFCSMLLAVLLAITAHAQSFRLKCTMPAPYPPLYIFDGLEICQENIAEWGIGNDCIKRIRIKPRSSDITQGYCGIIRIDSKLLIVLNDSIILKNKKDKVEKLSNIKRDDILAIIKIDRYDALSRYGIKNKYGGLLITTTY